MKTIANIILTIDELINTKKRRHIISGVLMTTAIFFGGLALTAMSIRMED